MSTHEDSSNYHYYKKWTGNLGINMFHSFSYFGVEESPLCSDSSDPDLTQLFLFYQYYPNTIQFQMRLPLTIHFKNLSQNILGSVWTKRFIREVSLVVTV